MKIAVLMYDASIPKYLKVFSMIGYLILMNLFFFIQMRSTYAFLFFSYEAFLLSKNWLILESMG